MSKSLAHTPDFGHHLVGILGYLFVALVIAGALLGVMLLGPADDPDSEREWGEWLSRHPDAPDVLRTDWQNRAAEAASHGQSPPPPLPF